jgi:hemolysin D
MNDMSATPPAKPDPQRPEPQRPLPPKDDPAKRAVRSNRDYAEFLPAAVEISVRPVPHVVPVLIGIILAAISTALVWAWVSSLDVFTNAAGRVRATVPPAVVQPLEAGRVTAIKVANGQKVVTGEPLVTLDDVAVRSALDAAIAGRASWLAEVQRRASAYRAFAQGIRVLPAVTYAPEIPVDVVRRENEALLTEHQALVTTLSGNAAARAEGEAKRARFQEVKAAKAKLVDILAERVAMTEALATSNAGSKAQILVATEARVRAEVDLADTSAQVAEIEANLMNLREQEAQAIASYLANQSKGIQAAERQVEQLDQEIVKNRDRLAHMTLRAPVTGTVQQLAATSVGQVVSPAQSLMVIVPDGAELIVEALVPSSDIGFVKEGDPVVIKADAFPFTRYGTFTGTVAALSAEAVTIRDAQGLQDPSTLASGQATQGPSGIPTVTGLFFIARIQLDSPELRAQGRVLRLEPGMTVRAEIKTETRKVIDYLLSPVTQVLKEAGHER